MNMPFGFDFMFSIVPIFIIIGFILIFGIIIFRGIQQAKQWNDNNNSPIITLNAEAISRKTEVSRYTHHHGHHHNNTSSTTKYYVTFEFESGERIEFHVPNNEYGMIVEGDKGKLTFQGSRYKEFQRNK